MVLLVGTILPDIFSDLFSCRCFLELFLAITRAHEQYFLRILILPY